MWYNKELEENGEYRDTEGKRYTVIECYRVIAPDGRMNAELGYTEFPDMNTCLKTWELVEIEQEQK